MVKRQFWIDRIESAWQRRSIVWLAGVRRSGKTYLCKSLDDTIYYDCERLQDRAQIEDNYELFLANHRGKRVILDEIHKLENPSEILKVAADHYPTIKIIATGSSSILASYKFKDALTGRKVVIHLTPMLLSEGSLFGNDSIPHRMLFGGLPDFFMSTQLHDVEYQEWLNSYWAKDIQELFNVDKKASFMKFTELILAHSGGMFAPSRFAIPSTISHPTASSYLAITQDSYVSTAVQPFSSHAITEIRSTPKVYGFDTGFVCHIRRWRTLRNSDLGTLWEHLVLNELLAHYQSQAIHYWRTKQGHEIDFVLKKNRNERPAAIECKWSSQNFNAKNLEYFRKMYPNGTNYLVAADIVGSYPKKYGSLTVICTSPQMLIQHLAQNDELY